MAPPVRPSEGRYSPLHDRDDYHNNHPPSYDSESTISETIYTPSDSDSHSVTKNEGPESDEGSSQISFTRLSNPPKYEDVAFSDKNAIVNGEGRKEGSPVPNPNPNSQRDTESGCKKARSRACCGDPQWRKRTICRRISIIVGNLFLFASLIYYLNNWMWYQTNLNDSDHRGDHATQDHQSPGNTPKLREIEIHQRSGSISGRYPLYDLLSLSTRSGSIAVIVDPQPADPNDPNKPAKIILNTRSGSIAVQFRHPAPDEDEDDGEEEDDFEDLEDLDDQPSDFDSMRKSIKHLTKSLIKKHTKHYKCRHATYRGNSSALLSPRPYEIEIVTRSGSIMANVAFSTSVKLSTRSGSINARLTPLVFQDADYLSTYNEVTISTRTRAGKSNIMLSEPFIFKKSTSNGSNSQQTEPVTTAVHSARGPGAVRVLYPHSWAGVVHATASRIGSVHVGGVRVIKKGRNFVNGFKKPNRDLSKEEQWWGAKGDMSVEVSARAGQAGFWVRKSDNGN